MAESGTVLVVEDDDNLRELIRLAGSKKAYRMAGARNGLEAKAMLEREKAPDLVVLDINMPGLDGFGFCRWMREDHPLLPVIFLSARDDEYDKILALEIGGDDYLTKPFSMKELFARIAVCLRRVELYSGGRGAPRTPREIASGGVRIDEESWTCEFRGASVYLTISEFRILRKLMENPGMAIGRERLAEAAFPEDRYNLGRSVDVHVCRIRGKLIRIDSNFDSIETVFQLGYKWKG